MRPLYRGGLSTKFQAVVDPAIYRAQALGAIRQSS